MSYDPNHYTDCCYEGCYATICLSPKNYERLRRTGEWFYCPAGHQQHFTGKTDEQKQIDRLQSRLDTAFHEISWRTRNYETLVGVLRRCPICAATPGRYVRVERRWPGEGIAAVRDWLVAHLAEEHGADVPADRLAALSEDSA